MRSAGQCDDAIARDGGRRNRSVAVPVPHVISWMSTAWGPVRRSESGSIAPLRALTGRLAAVRTWSHRMRQGHRLLIPCHSAPRRRVLRPVSTRDRLTLFSPSRSPRQQDDRWQLPQETQVNAARTMAINRAAGPKEKSWLQ